METRSSDLLRLGRSVRAGGGGCGEGVVAPPGGIDKQAPGPGLTSIGYESLFAAQMPEQAVNENITL